MSIRFVDCSSDHRPQNPPPEESIDGLTQLSGCIRVMNIATPDVHSVVLRGVDAAAVGPAVVDMSFAPTQTPLQAPMQMPAESHANVAPHNIIDLPSTGWVHRDTGGKYQVGVGAERIVCKIRPRWQLSATSPKCNEPK